MMAQFGCIKKLNSANYFDIMLECPDNSAGIMEIKAMDDLALLKRRTIKGLATELQPRIIA